MFQWLAYEYINVMTNSILGSKCNDNFAISKVSQIVSCMLKYFAKGTFWKPCYTRMQAPEN
jgi:hypothetical protein